MADVKRIHIRRDDSRKLSDWFNIELKTRPDFQILFHRTVEILEHFFETDSEDVLEMFKQQWAIEEANAAHKQEKS